jgi:hypothetical protein
MKIEKPVISTLDNDDVKLTCIRRNGNSTRQIDEAIQCLFNGYKVIVQDHAIIESIPPHRRGDVRTNRISQNLFDRILKRIALEHNHLIKNNTILIDKANLTMELK